MSIKKRGVVLVLFLLLLVLGMGKGVQEGCYYYPDSNLYCLDISDSDAADDCAQQEDCDISQYFSPGTACSEFDECQQILCTENCDLGGTFKGECERLGGEEIDDVTVMFNDWCSEGCCRVGVFCQYLSTGGTKWKCIEQAELQAGFSADDITWITPTTDPNMDGAKCYNDICTTTVSLASLKVCVSDSDGLLEGVLIGLGEDLSGSTGADGCYEFTELNPRSYFVTADMINYARASASVSLAPGESKEISFTLVESAETVTLSGRVTDADSGDGIPARVSWTGGLGADYTSANEYGAYEITGLIPDSQYQIRASMYGYETGQKTILITPEDNTLEFELTSIAMQGVSGIVELDEDGDGVGERLAIGASVFIDGSERATSNIDGHYEITLSAGNYEIYATYPNYEMDEVDITITDRMLDQPLVLTKSVGECDIEAKPPEDFLASHKLGERAVELTWTRPCPEVSGYKIYRYKGTTLDGEWTVSPIALFETDRDVEWGETYTYKIEALFSNPMVSPQVEYIILTGDEECEGKYHGAPDYTFEKFCLLDDPETELEDERRIVWTCDETNTLDETLCPSGEFYCAEISEMDATCRYAGSCGWDFQGADPFGLYYDMLLCYGLTEGLFTEEEVTKEDIQTACYFDYTNTIADRCESCGEIDNCFDYKSEDACVLNSCFGTKCEWISSAQGIDIFNWPDMLLETGHGYCVEENYDKEDYCDLCGPEGELFENYFCTPEICSGLGACFAVIKAGDFSSCGGCKEDSTCYSYKSELECTGGIGVDSQPLTVDRNSGKVTLSEDSCSLGRCEWDNPGGSGSCRKDGDDEWGDDCLSGEVLCQRDNQAPTTEVVSDGVVIISQANPVLTFYAEDNNDLGVLGYCWDDVNAQACFDFEEEDYLGSSEENKEVTLFAGENIGGADYLLRFYSIDEYSNREDVKETIVFVDTMAPNFDIIADWETTADTTDLEVYLSGMNEPMSCSFELEPLIPAGASIIEELDKDADKEVSYTGLTGIHHVLLTVTCEDGYGNVNEKSGEYVFDLVEEIDIIHPKGAVRETEITFEVETLIGANCELYEEATGRSWSFIADAESKHHTTEPISDFDEGSYTATHYVVCRDLLTGDLYEEYFNFEVDYTAADTQIILTEGERTVYPFEFGWEENFVRSVSVSFECDEEGFECDKTYYCLTEEEYEPKLSSCYEEFSGEFDVIESTGICYYSTDLGGNEGHPLCGKILVEGHGITLVKPLEYYYLEEKWGISNELVFDWEIMTKVATQECRFDFIEEFDYEGTALYQILPSGGIDYHYLFEDFPGDILDEYSSGGGVKELYVKCKDLEGEVGPAQKINLEYDPTAPEITDAYAEPDEINAGRETTLFVDTDDKTMCRYSDDSEGQGSSEYGLMEFKFPGEEDNILEIEHEDIFTINFEGANKTYNLLTQCKNGANNLSQVEEITFEVDYTAAGNIISTEPSGYIRSTEVTLRVLTNKNALCRFSGDEYSGETFEVTSGTEHTQLMSGLSEEEHLYLVHCRVGEYGRDGQIKFTVDLTPPVITQIDDGEISCSLSETPKVSVYTKEEAIKSYTYELYEQGNSSSGAGTLVKEGTIDAETSFEIDYDLEEDYFYYFKIKAEDEAGNVGDFKESDGFLAVPSSYDACVNDTDAPDVIFEIEETCTKTIVEMYCEDETGRDEFDYGESFASEMCEAVEPYNGQQILFEKTGWLCYYVTDVMGNYDEGTKRIDFLDEDGDGIADHCDECPDTEAGKFTDDEGCSSDQISDADGDKDTDGDGLPDYWEKRYGDCGMDYASDDFDNDGVLDADEDFDNDGYTNYDEFMMGLDPCAADAPPDEDDVDVRTRDVGDEEPSVLAWTLFILGWLLVLGGSGYLIYYYRSAVKGPVKRAVPTVSKQPLFKSRAPWKERLLALRRKRKQKARARERESLFGAFSKGSKNIPHIEEAIKKKGPHLERLGALAKKHAKIKEKIKPGLKPGEKGIFKKLEDIAEKTKKKDIKEVVSKKEAKNIFDKLKEISKKRKG